MLVGQVIRLRSAIWKPHYRTNAVRAMATLSVCSTGGRNVPTRSDDRAAAEGCGCRHGGGQWAKVKGGRSAAPPRVVGGQATQGGGRRSAPLPWAMMLRPFRPVVRSGVGMCSPGVRGKRSATPLFFKGTSEARPRRYSPHSLPTPVLRMDFHCRSCLGNRLGHPTKPPHAKTQKPRGWTWVSLGLGVLA